MPMYIADGWKDYEVLDTGSGEKLERWGKIILRRPDPQVIWPAENESLWKSADAHYHRSTQGGGQWEMLSQIPEQWTVSYRELTFRVRPTGFKHTGLFPEQAANWDWMSELIRGAHRPVRVLNLFAYTGGATMACLNAGAEVCHVDAAKGFRVLVALPKGTNTAKPAIKNDGGDDPQLWACNKWLFAHPDSAEAKAGAYVGLVGENVHI